jgi:hypothetical protein
MTSRGVFMRFVPILVALLGCATLPSQRGRGAGGAGAVEPVDTAWVAEVAVPRHLVRPEPAVEEAIARAIHALGAPDFGDFSAAAKALVALGEPAIPYLGFAAGQDGPDERIPITLRAILKNLPAQHVAPYLGSPYAEVRSAAATTAGERRLTELAPALTDLLEDADLDVRRASVAALRRITNRFHGFRPDAPAEDRAAAVAKWRRMWA